jgi:5-methylcytosine-specific restriction endonuclease McrBC GTP-binding regulatory subunit McrB
MDPLNLFIMTKTNFGYKLVKADKIIDLTNFNITQVNADEYYLEKKINYKEITSKSLGKYDFTGCLIKQCLLDNNLIQIKSLHKLLEKVYLIINNKEQIKKNSLLNIEFIQNDIRGWNQIKKLGISYPKPKSNMLIHEIVKQIETANINIVLKLELENDQLIKIKV